MSSLVQAIQQSWDGDTSVTSDWTASRPSRGQCAVTALVVQDYLGGDLLRATVEGTSHYWNRLPDGQIIDLSREQFDLFEPIDIERRTREYVLSYPDTAERYRKLALRTRNHLLLDHVGDSFEV